MCDISLVIADIFCHIIVLVELYGTFVMEGKPLPEAEVFTVVDNGTPEEAPAEEDPFAYAREPMEQSETENGQE